MPIHHDIIKALNSGAAYKITEEDRKRLFEFDQTAKRTTFEEYYLRAPEFFNYKRLIKTGVFSTKEEIDRTISLIESQILVKLMYFHEGYGFYPNLVMNLLTMNVATGNYPPKEKEILLDALYDANQRALIINGTTLLRIIKANIPQHCAFFTVESAYGKPVKISYLDGNAPLARDEDGQAYGEVSFRVDPRKIKGLNLAHYLEKVDLSAASGYGSYKTRIEAALLRVVKSEGDKLIVFQKNIPVKPQDRGNCSLKTTLILTRAIISRKHPKLAFDTAMDRGFKTYKLIFKDIARRNVEQLLDFVRDPENQHNPYHSIALNSLQRGVLLQAVSKGDFALIEEIIALDPSINLNEIETIERKYNALNSAASTNNETTKVAALRWCVDRGIQIGATESQNVKKALFYKLGLSIYEIDKMVRPDAKEDICREEFTKYYNDPLGKRETATDIIDVFIKLYELLNSADIGIDAAMLIFGLALEDERIVKEESIGEIWSKVFSFHKDIFERGQGSQFPGLLECFIDRFNINLNAPASGSDQKSGEILLSLAPEESRIKEFLLNKTKQHETSPPTLGRYNPSIDEKLAEGIIDSSLKCNSLDGLLRKFIFNINTHIEKGEINILEAGFIFHKILQRVGMTQDPLGAGTAAASTDIERSVVDPENIKKQIIEFYKDISPSIKNPSIDFFKLLVKDFDIDLASKMPDGSVVGKVILDKNAPRNFPKFKKYLKEHLLKLGIATHAKFIPNEFFEDEESYRRSLVFTPVKIPPPPSIPNPHLPPVILVPNAPPNSPRSGYRVAPFREEPNYPIITNKAPAGGLRTNIIKGYSKIFREDIFTSWSSLFEDLNSKLHSQNLNSYETSEIISNVCEIKGPLMEIEFSKIEDYCKINKENPHLGLPLREILEAKFVIDMALETPNQSIQSPKKISKRLDKERLDKGGVIIVDNPLRR
jgi:hypothetical protein